MDGNITALEDLANPNQGQTFAYDALHRLTGADGAYGNLGYAYNAMGNATQAGSLAFSYDAKGRMTSVDPGKGQPVTYRVNALGQRSVKTDKKDRLFAYDTEGHLIGEYDDKGSAIREYVYLGDRPLAMVVPGRKGTEVYFIHTDHLGTPKLLTDEAGKVVWEGQYRPFGEASVTGNVEQPLRFPGQYFDAESGLHYNYYRDYEPGVGRYIESDPIGQTKSLSLYSYASFNPIQQADPLGLFSISFGGGGFGHVATLGGGAESGFMVDHGGTVCFYTRQCSTVGWGLAGSIGFTGGIGTGRLCSGVYGSAGAMSIGGFGVGTAVSTEVTGRNSPDEMGIARGLAGPSGGRFGGFVGCRYDLNCFNEADECNEHPCAKK